MKDPRKHMAEHGEQHSTSKTLKPVPDRRHWLAPAALCGLTLLAYANSLGSGFVLDNRGILLQDPRVHAATAENLRLILQHTYWWPYGEGGLYRPLTTLTYLFNYAVLGNRDNAAGYHWVNLLLHAGNVLLVYLLARRLLREFWPPVFLAAVWAVHPVLTESVTNIVGRADLLAGAALLGGFWMYLKSGETAGWRRWAWLGGLLAATTAGAFSKESAAMILGVIILYELTWWKERRQSRVLLPGCAAVGLALGTMWYVRGAVFAHLAPARFPYWDNPLVDAGFWTARLTALKVLAKYLGLLVWPAQLSCDYSYNQIPLADGSVGDWIAWLTVGAAAAAAVWMYRRNRMVFFWIGLAFLTLLPTSNLPFAFGTIMAERFLYLPATALAACVVVGCYSLARRVGRPAAAPIALCLIIIGFTVRTLERNADWHDDMSLMTAAVASSPNSYKSHMLLAAAMYDSDPTHANIDRAIAEAEMSMAILGPVADWHNNPDSFARVGEYYLVKGDLLATRGADGKLTPSQESHKAYQRSLELLLRVRAIVRTSMERERAEARARGYRAPEQDDVKVAAAERGISMVELRLNDLPGALQAARNAQRLDPLNAESYRQLSGTLLAGGHNDEAATALVEGTLVTSNQSLRQELLRVYQGELDAKSCAITAGPYGPAINPKCDLVHRHLCAAAAEAIDLYTRMGRENLVEQMRDLRFRQFDCR